MSTPGEFGTLAITLAEEARTVSISTTLDSDHCASYVDAFRAALLGFGFPEKVADRYLRTENEA